MGKRRVLSLVETLGMLRLSNPAAYALLRKLARLLAAQPSAKKR